MAADGRHAARYRVGCDIGGTFTDFVLIDEATGAIRTAKRLTTPSDPSIAMLTGLAGLAENAPRYQGRTVRLAHATTLIANAVIERTGRPTALCETEGFRDVLELGRYRVHDIYDLFRRRRRAARAAPAALRVDERIRADGIVLDPLDPGGRAASRRTRGRGVESVAICFLHSYRNPAQRARRRATCSRAALHGAHDLAVERGRCPSSASTSAARTTASTPTCSP